MELAFAINREGLVDSTHETVYRQLGEWVRNCYGTPVLSKQNTVGEQIVKIPLPPNTPFDRIILEEDVAVGQRIRNYTIALVYDDNSYQPPKAQDIVVFTLVSNGTSVGRKRIHLLGKAYLFSDIQFRNYSVVLTITGEIGPPHLSMFGLYKPCHPESTG